MENQKIAKQLIPEDVHQKAQHEDLLDRERAEHDVKKNHHFVQMEKRSIRDIRGLIDRSPNAAKLLLIMAERMNKVNALLCSFKTLQEITGLGRTTLSQAVNLLKKERWIQVIKIGTANAYVVNSRVFWQSTGDKKHTVFNATVIASADEQDKEEWDNIDLRHFPMLLSEDTSSQFVHNKLSKAQPKEPSSLEQDNDLDEDAQPH